MKRHDAVTAVLIACVILVAFGTLVSPAKAPSMNPMDVTATRTTQTFVVPQGTLSFTFTFTFTNITIATVSTSYTSTTTLFYETFSTVLHTKTVSTSVTSTLTTFLTTKTSGTTTVASTVWSPATGTTTNRTITATASQTVTVTSYATKNVTSTSIFTVTGATPPSPPPIPGFPVESILAGIALGLLGIHLIYRNRRAKRKHST